MLENSSENAAILGCDEWRPSELLGHNREQKISSKKNGCNEAHQ